MIKTKRVFEPAEKADGFRMLGDRLWPRGLTKEATHVELWMKEISPSTALRKWFHPDPRIWPEFCTHYRNELKQSVELTELIDYVKMYTIVTFLFAAKDENIIMLYYWKNISRRT